MFAFAPYVLCPQVLQVGRNECRHEATGLRHRMVASFPFFSLRSCRRQVLKRIYLQSLNRRKVCLLRGGVKVSFVLADALSLVRRFPSDLYCDFRCGHCSRSRLCAVADRRGQNNEEKNEIRGSISYGATFAVKKTLRAPATAPLDVLGWSETNYSLPTCYYCERAWTREAQIGQLNRQRKRCRNVID